MKHRGVAAVVILTIVTFGIYGIVWYVKTKEEMKSLGADIPTAWLLIVPIANIFWVYKYAMGVEKVTNQKLNGVLSFILLYLLSIVGMAIVQSEFNKLTPAPVASPIAGSPPASPAVPDVPPSPVVPPAPASDNPTNPTPPSNPTPIGS